ncbi:MAG TPA: CARDB domain-containing protein, partial [Actinomycetota bacterium]|nr:CARDB domain-containing protein [Actinomycetota bacterium]
AGFTNIVITSTAAEQKGLVCTVTGQTINCVAPSTPYFVSGNALDPITLKFTANAPATPGTYTNTAVVDPDGLVTESNEGNNTATAAVTVGATLDTNKTCTADQPFNGGVAPGGTATCVVTVKNTSTIDAKNVVMTDNLPAGTTLVPGSVATPAPLAPGTQSFEICTSNPNQVQCTDGTLPAGATDSVQFRVTVTTAAQPGQVFTNTATATASNAGADTATAPIGVAQCTIDRRTATSGRSITGTSGSDVICGTRYADSINGLGGNDLIFGFGGNDAINGGYGDDIIFGGTGSDAIRGYYGNDKLYGESGNDSLYGQVGNDFTDGGTNTDSCYAEQEVNCEA